MPKILAALAFVFVVALASRAEALPSTCLTLPLPMAPLSPNFSLELWSGDDHASAKIWRQPCQDGSGQVAVLLRLTPETEGPHVCSFRALIVQSGIQLDGTFATSTGGSPPFPSFCEGLFVPTTVILLSGPNQPRYDEQAAFRLIYTGPPTTSVDIPAAPVPPPLPAPPTLTVHALGCTTCHSGNTLGFEVQVNNPGGPRLVELKTGARLPDGSAVAILGRYVEETIGPGLTVIPLFAGLVLPAGIPTGAYTIEAALLEPELGVTISRHSVGLTVGP